MAKHTLKSRKALILYMKALKSCKDMEIYKWILKMMTDSKE